MFIIAVTPSPFILYTFLPYLGYCLLPDWPLSPIALWPSAQGILDIVSPAESSLPSPYGTRLRIAGRFNSLQAKLSFPKSLCFSTSVFFLFCDFLANWNSKDSLVPLMDEFLPPFQRPLLRSSCIPKGCWFYISCPPFVLCSPSLFSTRSPSPPPHTHWRHAKHFPKDLIFFS